MNGDSLDTKELRATLDDVAYLAQRGSFFSAAKVFGCVRHRLEQRSREIAAEVRDTWEALTHHDAGACVRCIAELERSLQR